MVPDVATGAVFLEIVAGDMGKAQDIIQFSNGQESGVGGDGGTVKFQVDFGVPPELLRYLKKHTKLMSEL